MSGEVERSRMRASDAERTQVAGRLRRALDEGRLDLGEYDERLQQVYLSKTYGELDAVTADLPPDVVGAQLRPPIEAGNRLSPGRTWGIAAVVTIGILLVVASRFAAIVPVVMMTAFVVFGIVYGRPTDGPLEPD